MFLIFVVYAVTIINAFGGFDKDYSVTDLKENFEENKVEIYELKSYFNKIVPKGRFVEIEFKDDNTLAKFGISITGTEGNSYKEVFSEWDLEAYTPRMDSIIKPLGWTRETLKTIKNKLDNANCIKIESGEPAKIGFQRSGMGLYSFNVFDRPISRELKAAYNDSCTYILANDKLILEYGGGAVGPQCFYNMN
ncbi:hypothetical protein [Flavobacterium pallidum]|uniref:hypothetical protein n=1 Tax=Flavobacterium pallidum TaxID=2172098 RepID=UPI0011B22D1D|nr:hypothetical protein [Flavobacterium pallidum]